MPADATTNLERQIRSQPEALSACWLVRVRRQVHEAAERCIALADCGSWARN